MDLLNRFPGPLGSGDERSESYDEASKRCPCVTLPVGGFERKAAMYRSVQLKHFKCFETLQMPLSQITLLGGKNNVGKTSVLEALFLLADRANPNLFVRQLGWRGLVSLPLVPRAVWGPFFHKYDFRSPVEIGVEENGDSLHLEISYEEPLADTTFEVALSSDPSSLSPSGINKVALPYLIRLKFRSGGGPEQSATQRLTLGGIEHAVEHFERSVRNAVFIGSKMRLDPTEEADRFGTLDVEGHQDTVVNGLRTIEPRIQSITTIVMGDKPVLHARLKGQSRQVPLPLLGDGVTRLLSILLALEANPGGLILVDEVENGFHYSVLQDIWRAIGVAVTHSGCQLVATTHSIESLHAASVGLAQVHAGPDPLLSYVRLEARDDGRIMPIAVSAESLMNTMELNWEMR